LSNRWAEARWSRRSARSEPLAESYRIWSRNDVNRDLRVRTRRRSRSGRRRSWSACSATASTVAPDSICCWTRAARARAGTSRCSRRRRGESGCAARCHHGRTAAG
jgi:hypothetical protein